jgi:hypothetical protein
LAREFSHDPARPDTGRVDVAEIETPCGEVAQVQALKNTKAGFNFLRPVFSVFPVRFSVG